MTKPDLRDSLLRRADQHGRPVYFLPDGSTLDGRAFGNDTPGGGGRLARRGVAR